MDLFSAPRSNTSIAYDENSNPTSTIDHVHVRAATGARPFDVVYTLDGLNRLTMADEGHASGGPLAISSRTRVG